MKREGILREELVRKGGKSEENRGNLSGRVVDLGEVVELERDFRERKPCRFKDG